MMFWPTFKLKVGTFKKVLQDSCSKNAKVKQLYVWIASTIGIANHSCGYGINKYVKVSGRGNLASRLPFASPSIIAHVVSTYKPRVSDYNAWLISFSYSVFYRGCIPLEVELRFRKIHFVTPRSPLLTKAAFFLLHITHASFKIQPQKVLYALSADMWSNRYFLVLANMKTTLVTKENIWLTILFQCK